MVTRYPPWAKLLTTAMKEMYNNEVQNVHWKRIRRSISGLGVLFGSGNGSLLKAAAEAAKAKNSLKEREEVQRVNEEGVEGAEERDTMDNVVESPTTSKYAVGIEKNEQT
jgi:hypothetical protein